MLGALCASGLIPLSLEALERGVRKYLHAKIVDVNIAAARKGAEAVK